MERKWTSKGILLNLTYMRDTARKLLARGKKYDQFLRFLLQWDELYIEEADIPTIKEVAERAKLPYSKVTKYLRLIYDDMVHSYADDIYFEFKEIEYEFHLKSIWGNVVFYTKNLHQVPRIGEQVEIYFFKEQTRLDFFFVEKVSHRFENGKQFVEIQLETGFYNLYWHYRKDKAECTEELTMRDFFDLNDSQLKDKLKIYTHG